MKDLARLRNREDVLATTVLQKAPVIKEQSFCCLPVFETEMDLSNKANIDRCLTPNSIGGSEYRRGMASKLINTLELIAGALSTKNVCEKRSSSERIEMPKSPADAGLFTSNYMVVCGTHIDVCGVAHQSR